MKVSAREGTRKKVGGGGGGGVTHGVIDIFDRLD